MHCARVLLARSQALDKPLPAVGAQQVLDATALLSNRSSLSTAEAHALRVAEQDCLGDAASGPTTDGSAAAGSAAMGLGIEGGAWVMNVRHARRRDGRMDDGSIGR